MNKRFAPPPRPRRGWLTCGLVGILGLAALVIVAAVIAYFYFYGNINIPLADAPVSAMPPGPSVTIQQPGNGAQFTQGDSFVLFASANDPLGVIRLDLWVDDALVLSQSSPDASGLPTLSLSYPMVAAKTGTYTLVARAYNSQGLMGESVVHYVTIVEEIASTLEYAHYVVQPGDTLENIAQRLGLSVDDILRANPALVPGQGLVPGQVIIIPMPKGQPPQAAVPGPNGVQPVAVPGGGQPGGAQPGGGQQVPPPQRPAPVPANPSPQISVKSASVSPNPVFYGANCKAKPTALNVTAKIEPVASVSKVILAYSFITAAGARSQDIEIQMQLAGAEYKADINVGQEAEVHLAQAGGKLDVRVEAYDAANKLSISPIYTVDVQFCAAAPPPANKPSLTIKSVTASSPVWYGQDCITEPLISRVVATIEPANAVKTATLGYVYENANGSSAKYTLPLSSLGGSDFGANIDGGREAEKELAQAGGWITLWVEVLDTGGQTSISAPSTVTVTFCAAPQANLPPNLPGILPQFMPGAVPQPGAGVVQIEPVVFPMPGAVLGPEIGKVKDPSDLKAVSTDGCKVTLTWTDNATDETGYEVHRLDPGQPHYAMVASLKPNTTQFQDLTPTPGKYMYYVAAIRILNGAASGGGSYNAMVDVTQATNCKLTSGPHRLMFRPISFSSSGFPKAYVLLTLGKFSPIRAPRAGQDYLPVGDWSAAGEWSIPLPQDVLKGPGDSLVVEVRGTGFSPDGPTDLSGFQRSHTYESLADPAARTTDWSGTDPLARFELVYRLWLDNWQWGGAISDPSLPAPTNLKLDMTDPFNQKLTWDYDKQAKPRIDGFAIYQKYSCPGGVQDMHDVVTRGQGNSTADQQFAVQTYKQPAGCACQYQVSAFTRTGESKLSAPTTEKCETGAPQVKVAVTFNTFTMSQNAPRPGDIYLFAGEFARESATMIFEGGRTYELQNLYFDGNRNNNRFLVPLAAAGDAAVEYTITPGAMVAPNICNINPQVIKFSPAAAVYGESRLFQLTGSCGSGCTCEINGKVEAIPASQGAPGGGSAGGGWNKIGAACASDSECLSGYCKSGVCAPDRLGLQGAECFANDQCVSGVCLCAYIGRPDIPEFACSGLPSPLVSGMCLGPSDILHGNGEKCSNNYACASGYCANGLCAPKDGFGRVGDYCHHNNHCGNHYCVCPQGYDGDFCKGYQWFSDQPGQHGTCGEWPGAVNGDACQVDNDCQSRHCADNKCAPINGTGLDGEYCHINKQCASNICSCPGGINMGPGFFGEGVPCADFQNFTPTNHGTCEP